MRSYAEKQKENNRFMLQKPHRIGFIEFLIEIKTKAEKQENQYNGRD